MAQYMTFGSILYDTVQQVDGTIVENLPGGHSLYALSGLRLWTKSCKMHAVVGEDFKDGFIPWLDANGIETDKIEYDLENTPRVHMTFQKEGNFNVIDTHAGPPFAYELGFLASRPSDIERALESDTKAVYHHTFKPDYQLFKAMGRLREKYGIKFMWEVMYPQFGGPKHEDPERVRFAATTAGMWSLNEFEASMLYDIPRGNDDDFINEIIKAGGEFCLFRVGKRGAYAVAGNTAYFCPSIDIKPTVDPTGCGNSSTGASMWAWCETGDPAFSLAVANISAGHNASQSGPWPLYSDDVMANALDMAKDLAEKIRNKHV